MKGKYPLHDVEDERGEAHANWLSGVDPLPFARMLLEDGQLDELAVVCRYALIDEEDEAVRAELEALLAESGHPPVTWDDALVELADNPTVEGWKALMEWVPLDDLYLRSRVSIRRLRELEVEPNLLFRMAATIGPTPDAIELADTGAASPDTILEVAEEALRIGPFWKVLAARSAAARGEMSRAVWLANQASSGDMPDDVATIVRLQLRVLEMELDEDHREMLL